MSSAPSGVGAARTRRLFALLAGTAFVLTFVVLVVSAFIRHTQAGLDCVEWPSCYARVAAEAPAASLSIGVHIARILHRLAASSALLLIIVMLLLSRGVHDYRSERGLVVASLVIALGLAALGIATPDAEVPAVPLGNLVGGYLMLAVLAALVGTAVNAARDSASRVSAGLRGFALALLAVVFVQAVLGGLIGMQFALQACPALDHCATFGDPFARDGALNPFLRPVVSAGHVLPPAGAGQLHLLHRLLGVAITLATLALAIGVRSSHRRCAVVLASLALIAPLLGATAILRMPSLTITVLHNAAAAALIATLAYVLARRGRAWHGPPLRP